MHSIRKYDKSDYPMLKSWWEAHNEPVPSEDLMSELGTFIFEIRGEPILSISVILTNVPGMCFLENFIANPTMDKNDRKEYSQMLVNYALNFAKALGYKRAVCFSYRDSVKARYENLGMTKTLDNLSSFVREL